MGGSGGGSVDFGKPSREPETPRTRPPEALGGSGGLAGSGGDSRCAAYTVDVILQSPTPFARNVKVGQELDVELRGTTVFALSGTTTVGVILPSTIRELINCINAGTKYVAEVTKVQGGAVTVRVRAR